MKYIFTLTNRSREYGTLAIYTREDITKSSNLGDFIMCSKDLINLKVTIKNDDKRSKSNIDFNEIIIDRKLNLKSLFNLAISCHSRHDNVDNNYDFTGFIDLILGSSKLDDLSINWFDISLKNSYKLAGAFVSNKSLTSIDLSNNNIKDDVITILVSSLHCNVNLRTLDSSFNKISDMGAKAISMLLENNKILNDLLLNYNQITDIGAFHLKEVITKNNSLGHLSLCDNKLTKDGITAMIYGLKENFHMYFLHLDTKLEFDEKETLYKIKKQYLSRNREIINYKESVEKIADYKQKMQEEELKAKIAHDKALKFDPDCGSIIQEIEQTCSGVATCGNDVNLYNDNRDS